MKRISLYTFLLAGSLVVGGCKKFVDIPPPQNQLSAELVFTDDQTAHSAMVGLYSLMNQFNNQFANYMGNFLPAMSADEFHYALSSATFDEYKNNSLIAGNSYVKYLWDQPYRYIYHANAILEGLSSANGVSEAVKKQIAGEARFVRAFCYFYLVNYFGDVPLILNTDYKTNTSLGRTNKEAVWAALLTDLQEAQANLSPDYATTERVRANKAAATALLARAYLYRENWAGAEAEASKVIADNRYVLLDDLNKVFLKNSPEAIWQLQTVNTSTKGVNTWEGFSIVPAAAGGRAYYHVYDSFLEAFETGDKRKDSWITSYTNASGTFFYPFKYKVRTRTPVEEYSMVLRLAEQYLVRAEARAQQGNLEGAIEDLNVLRERAGLDPLEETLGKEEVLLAVEQERRIELFAEWGHRWLDLRRTGRALEVLTPIKPGITADDLWYPIPLDARKTNPNLGQNKGYE